MGREKEISQIVSFLGAILQGRRLVIFMELMPGKKKKIQVSKLVCFATQSTNSRNFS